MIRCAFVVALLAGTAASGAFAVGPMPIAQRTGGLLVSDTTTEQVMLIRDRDGDGIDPQDEVVVFFDGTNASGLAAPTAQVLGLYQTDDHTVYITDVTSDRIYAVRDNNGDGDALDAGEAREFLSAASLTALGYTFNSAAGITGDATGAIFFVNAGTGSGATLVPDAVFRVFDVNGDGNIYQAGDITLWFDTQTLITGSSASDIALLNGTAYIADLLGTAPDGVLRASDTAPADGSIGAGEFGVFIDETNAFGVRTGFPLVSDGTALYVAESTGTVGRSIWRLADTVAPVGQVNDATEIREVWNVSLAPAGVLSTLNGLAIGPNGQLAFTNNSGTSANDAVFLLTDGGDGDWLDPNETEILISGTAASEFPETPRAVIFYAEPPPVCRADFDHSGAVDVADIFSFLSAWFSNSAGADFNDSGTVDVSDIFAFLSAWFAGCP